MGPIFPNFRGENCKHIWVATTYSILPLYMKNKNTYSIPNVGKYTMEPALDRFYFVTFQPQKRPSRSNPLPNNQGTRALPKEKTKSIKLSSQGWRETNPSGEFMINYKMLI